MKKIPQIDFGRNAAQSAKQVISSKLEKQKKIDNMKIL